MLSAPFELLSSTAIGSLGLELSQYRHPATAARHLHFACDDGNNAFMVALPTLPQDSTGVAHILEHTTLCGSQRYPVRDPFFMMLRRSLNTFMNAFTAGDSTAYPFATQNRKDFDNLLRVYLDAVFFPQLDLLDFAQEGWRLELAGDAAQPRLEYHGVVYNEMKGAMSAPLAQLWQHLHAALYPDTVYRHNSGGDPLAIPDLTHAALRAFHTRHYHPGHAVFMTYGNFAEREHQALMAELVLERFSAPAHTLASPLQARFTAARNVITSYALDQADSDETHIVWAWQIGETADVQELVHAHLLSAILLEHSASPLRHCLETTELANAPSELCGVDDSGRQLTFVCGVEGSDAAHAEALERAVFEVLERVARDGVDAPTLDAILDRIEMAQRDIGGGSYPFGLQLMGRVMPAVLTRRDPVALLDLDPVLARMRAAIRDPGFASGLVRRLLLDNPHRVRVVMAPDPGLAARDQAAERARLDAIALSLDADGRAALAAQAAALRERQARVDDADILPRVTLADVPPPSASPAARVSTSAGGEVLEYECAANGVFRVQVVYDLPRLSAEELRLLPLFADYLCELGTRTDDYLTVQAARARVGSFGTNTLVRAAHGDGAPRGWFAVTGKGLARKRGQVIATTLDILRQARFDEIERLHELLAQSRAEAEQSISDRGHQLAVMSAARGLSRAAALDELWDGPSAVLELRRLGSGAIDRARLGHLFATFAAISDKLAQAPCRVALLGDAASLHGARDEAVACMPSGGAGGSAFDIVLDEVQAANGWLANTQVNFCAKAYAAVGEDHPDAPALNVLGRYLQDGFLHGAIREQGGAYGAGASYDADSATFRFYSYRDPRAAATLADFDRALAWFADDRDGQRLEEAILGSIRALDQPRSPAGEAERAFVNRLYGRDDAFRARFRSAVLAVDHAGLQAVAERYLDPTSGAVAAVCTAAAEPELAALGLRFARL